MSEKQKKLRHGNGGDDTDHRGKDPCGKHICFMWKLGDSYFCHFVTVCNHWTSFLGTGDLYD